MVLWITMPCIVVSICRRFGGKYWLHLQGSGSVFLRNVGPTYPPTHFHNPHAHNCKTLCYVTIVACTSLVRQLSIWRRYDLFLRLLSKPLLLQIVNKEWGGHIIIIIIIIIIVCRDSVVGTATHCGLDGRGMDFRWGRGLTHPQPAFCAVSTGSLYRC